MEERKPCTAYPELGRWLNHCDETSIAELLSQGAIHCLTSCHRAVHFGNGPDSLMGMTVLLFRAYILAQSGVMTPFRPSLDG